MFWFHCFQVVSLCLHDSSFWILLRVKLSVMGGWRGRGHCVSDQRHGHAQHILIRRWAALLRLVRASHPSPSHFRLSMAFQTFFVTSLERAAILTPRVSGSGGTESAGPCRWRTTTTPPTPRPSSSTCKMLHSCWPTSFIVLLSVWMHHNHTIITLNRRSQHGYTASHLPVAKKEADTLPRGFVLHVQISATAAENWQSPAWHPISVGSESNSICSW